jgi:hypothetical protein
MHSHRQFLLAGLAVLLTGCGGEERQLKEVKALEGFQVPECVLVAPDGQSVYVSNVVAATSPGPAGPYWTADGTGSISLLKSDGSVVNLKWVDSGEALKLDQPKGMCIVGDDLYVADGAVVRVIALRRDLHPPRTIQVPGARRLNDMATDGKSAYVSDTEAGVVYRLREGGQDVIKAPASVNGITFAQGRMFAVSWDLHEVYELDPEGKKEPVAFGVAAQFSNLDGIEALADGTLVVSDFTGNKVCAVSPDRKTVRTLVQVETPADIGLDRQRNWLWVPQFMKDRVRVYQLGQ